MQFTDDAGLFAFQLDLLQDRVLLVETDEATLEAASFLDQRLIATPPAPPMRWEPYATLDGASRGWRDDAGFIFHIGHVGSTLLSRLLGTAEDTLALREPLILRQLAELGQMRGKPESPLPWDAFDGRLASALRWLSRTFRPGQRALVKATSFASAIAPDIVTGDRRVIFLTLSPERYIQTILAGKNSRVELASMAASRLTRLHERMDGAPYRLWELGEAQRAALAWACEMSALEAADGPGVLWLDFDRFLADPAVQLSEAARHLCIDLPDAGALVAGPHMTRYSKAPEHAYSPQLREDVLAHARVARGEEIAAALTWLENEAAEHRVLAKTLERSATP